MSEPEKFDYFYSQLQAQVFVTETNGGRYKVIIDNPHGARGKPFAAKVFTRGADPSKWIGEQLAKIMPTLVAELHKYRNDDWKSEPEPADDPHGYRDDSWVAW